MASYLLVFCIVAVGLLLILLDIMVIPGGVVAIAGITLIVGVQIYSYKSMGPAFTLNSCIVTAVMAVVLGFLVWRFRLWKVMQLHQQEDKETGFVSYSTRRTELIGKMGETFSTLRPGGTVRIEGKKYDAVTEGSLLEKGVQIKVLEVRGAQVVVRKIQN